MRLIPLWSCLMAMMIADANAVELDAKPGQMIPVSVARSGLSRIALSDNVRISNVWGRSSMVEIETDSEGGQVFIKPRVGATSFALYLRDEHGATYSLLLSPVDGLPDSIVLRVPGKEVPMVQGHADNILRQMRLLVQDGVGYSIGNGYMRELPWWPDSRLFLLRSHKLPNGLWAEHYQLRHDGNGRLRLYEAEFARIFGVVAVQLDLLQLAPGGVANIYMLRRR